VDSLRGNLNCHCEEPQATWQSLKMEAGLLRFARNDMKISESHVSTNEVSFLNLDSRIKVEVMPMLIEMVKR